MTVSLDTVSTTMTAANHRQLGAVATNIIGAQAAAGPMPQSERRVK